MIRGIHHISMKCATQEEFATAKEFYCKLLGMKLCREWPEGAMIDTGAGLIEIFCNGKGIREKGAIRHVALSVTDVDSLVARIQDAGYSVFIEPKDIVIPSNPLIRARIAFCVGSLGEEIELFCEEESLCSTATSPVDSSLLLRLILSRHSYRGKYKQDKVPREHLRLIMEAGLAAPSGCNKQTTSLIAVDDSAVLDKLKAVIDPPVASTAPAMICVLTQRIHAYRDRCFSTQDYAAAIENMLLAIVELGYQSCWYEGHITDIDRIGDKLAKILGVSDEYELVCILPVGVAEDEVTSPKKHSFEERAWFNGYRRKEFE